MIVCPNAQLPTPPAGPLYNSSRPLPSKTTPLPCSSHSSIRLARTMSADSFFKIPSYDSSLDEDEVQRHSLSEEASGEYMDLDLIPEKSSDTEEEEDTDEEYDEDDDDDEPEDDDVDE